MDKITSIPSVIDAIIRAQQQLISFFFSILKVSKIKLNGTKKDYYQNFVNYFNCLNVTRWQRSIANNAINFSRVNIRRQLLFLGWNPRLKS
jgi:DNA-binding transcriptional regulator GbsR (MarR family)